MLAHCVSERISSRSYLSPDDILDSCHGAVHAPLIQLLGGRRELTIGIRERTEEMGVLLFWQEIWFCWSSFLFADCCHCYENTSSSSAKETCCCRAACPDLCCPRGPRRQTRGPAFWRTCWVWAPAKSKDSFNHMSCEPLGIVINLKA